MRHTTPRSTNGRTRWRRTPLSLVFLLLGIVLLLGAAFQAYGNSRSQRRTVEQVLQSYAGMAAWNLDQHITPTFRDGVETLFHPLHELSYSDGRRVPLPIAALIDRADRSCVVTQALLAATRYGVRFALRGADVTATASLSDTVRDALTRELRAHYLRSSPRDQITGHEAAHAFVLGDSAALVLYSPKAVPGDTLFYALVLDATRLGPIFERVLAKQQLLPEPLVNGIASSELLSLSLALPSGPLVYGPPPGETRSGARTLAKLGGLVATITLLERAGPHLVPTDAAALRGPFLLAMLALAIGLLLVAFSQIRREYALARMRSDFVASVSHELRTPLALQRVFLDMLKLGRVDTPERQQWCFENVDRESMRLAHLVENVLAFARAEQGTMRVSMTAAPLAPLVNDIVHAFEPLAAAAHTRIITELQHDVTAPVDADALRQVLMNLLENAVKYGPAQQTITLRLALAEQQTARITIDDQGAGVPLRERALVFQPFRRGTATASSAVAGSGIGLAVVRELVRRHRGRVYVSDAPGGGARFVVELPDARTEPHLSTPHPAPNETALRTAAVA